MPTVTWTDDYDTFSVVLEGPGAVLTTDATPTGERVMGFRSGVERILRALARDG